MLDLVSDRKIASDLEDNCLERIQIHLDQIAGSVRRVAEYILANPWEARGISIGELARHVAVSENTISRFCVAIGYSGYREFSTQLASTLGRLFGAAYAIPPEITEETTADTPPFQIVSNVITMEVQCIQETLRQLDRTAVEDAVGVLGRAKKVLLVGMGATSAAASTAAYRLVLLGIDAIWLSDPYALVAQANLMSEGDVVVGIFYHGQARVICETLRIARSNGATAIAVTAAPNSPLAKSADICLTVASPAPLFSKGQFSARVAGVLLMDALVAAVAWARHRGTPPRLLKTFEFQREFLEYHQGETRRSRA